MKVLTFLLRFVAIFGSVVSCNLLRRTQTSLTIEPSREFLISGLMKDWNRKSKDIKDVVVFNIGNRSKVLENLVKIIPKENPVRVMDPDQCDPDQWYDREVSFIFIVSNSFETVSGCVIFQKPKVLMVLRNCFFYVEYYLINII